MTPDNLLIVNNFPYIEISKIAEKESWRKEVYRPIYHMHKWWANRLGSVFRSILISCYVQNKEDFFSEYYNPTLKNWDMTIFDPFMGSGTTIGEGARLRIKAKGQDINPISAKLVKNIFEIMDINNLEGAFLNIKKTAEDKIKHYYTTIYNGEICQVLYYFWVKYIICPGCNEPIYLFDNYIFSKHAYTKKHPEVQIICPNCFNVIKGNINDQEVKCDHCNKIFNPNVGRVNGQRVFCEKCNEYHKIAPVAKAQQFSKQNKMFAKMLLTQNQTKVYEPINTYDIKLFNEAKQALNDKGIPIQKIKLKAGYNTNQALNFGYTDWTKFFNERQLLTISFIADAINEIEDKKTRNTFGLLLSGVLEFNNMFTSFKGEGTGAVRHMFSNHILKPEKTPLEANLWGTSKSSGSFSTLYKTRLLRAIDYIKKPFEIDKLTCEKVFISNDGLSEAKLGMLSCGDTVEITCGDSSNVDLDDETIDFVITDPPFFDNVHYSELADFFLPWHKILFSEEDMYKTETTRNLAEVQDVDSIKFSSKLQLVFAECNRVLKKDGLLIFSYHHSKDDGWTSLIDAICKAGFIIINSFPVKSELSVSEPKSQAKSPINMDIIFVCSKQKSYKLKENTNLSYYNLIEKAKTILISFNNAGFTTSFNDFKIISYSEIIKEISKAHIWELLADKLKKDYKEINNLIQEAYDISN